MNKFFCLIFLFVSLVLGLNATASQHTSEFDSAITQHIKSTFNGAILIAKGEDILFEKAYGFADREEQKSLSTQNQFMVASISKQITAALVLQQVDASRIKLTDSIKTYLPEINDDWAVVTIHNLLNHTSGIQELGQPLNSRPGEKFSYSNTGYDILGEILEKVTGRKFDALSADLFKACNMSCTVSPATGCKTELQALYKELAVGYVKKENQIQRATFKREVKSNPSGGIISTLHDLHQWNLHLHNGKILASETYVQMVTPTVTRQHRWGEIGYGYGLQVLEKNGVREFSHNGIIEGATLTVTYCPDSEFHLVILGNTNLETNGWGIAEQKLAFFEHDMIRELVFQILQK